MALAESSFVRRPSQIVSRRFPPPVEQTLIDSNADHWVSESVGESWSAAHRSSSQVRQMTLLSSSSDGLPVVSSRQSVDSMRRRIIFYSESFSRVCRPICSLLWFIEYDMRSWSPSSPVVWFFTERDFFLNLPTKRHLFKLKMVIT